MMKNSKLVLCVVFMLISALSSYSQVQLDPDFNGASVGTNDLEHVTEYPNGDYLVSGSITPFFARLKHDGSLDTSFQNTTTRGRIISFEILNDNTIIASVKNSPDFIGAGNPNGYGIYRLSQNNDTILGMTFNGFPPLLSSNGPIFFLPDSIYHLNGTDLVAYNVDDKIMLASLPAFNPWILPFADLPSQCIPIFSILTRTDGKIFFGANKGFLRYTMGYPSVILNADDIVFNNNILSVIDVSYSTTEIHSLAFTVNGGILIGGYFKLTAAHGGGIVSLIKVDSTGLLDNNFSITTVDNVPYSISVGVDEKIFIAGNFSTPAHYIARLNPDGTSDTDFNNSLGTGADSPARCALIQNDSELVVCGSFTSIWATPCNRIVRLESSTSSTLGESFIENSKFEIYPNPTDGELHFQNYLGLVELFNSTGQIVFNQNLTELNSIIHFPLDLKSGIYLIKMSNEENLIKQIIVLNR